MRDGRRGGRGVRGADVSEGVTVEGCARGLAVILSVCEIRVCKQCGCDSLDSRQ